MATQEEKTALEEIAKSIAHVNETTQSYAAGAEELTANTEEMVSMAETMREKMEYFNDLIEQLLKDVDFSKLTPEQITGESGLLKQLTKRIVEKAMNTEMKDHLGYEINNPDGNNTGNSRNGTSKKTVLTEIGDVDIAIPRDRNSEYEPQNNQKASASF